MPSTLSIPQQNQRALVTALWSAADRAKLNRLINAKEKKGLGMEYIVLLHPNTGGTCCMLCGNYFHMNILMEHVSSNHHGLAFCEMNFPHLYETNLKKLFKANFHELISVLLDTISKCIYSRYLVPSPTFVEPESFDEQVVQLHAMIMNAPHISENLFRRLNYEIMSSILHQTREIERQRLDFIKPTEKPNKKQIINAKLKLSAVAFDAITSPSENALRNVRTKSNVALLMMNLNSELVKQCNLDLVKILAILERAVELEAIFPNSSNTLLSNEEIRAFIIRERQKIVAESFEPGFLQNLKELTLLMMDNLIGPIVSIPLQNRDIQMQDGANEEVLDEQEEAKVENVPEDNIAEIDDSIEELDLQQEQVDDGIVQTYQGNAHNIGQIKPLPQENQGQNGANEESVAQNGHSGNENENYYAPFRNGNLQRSVPDNNEMQQQIISGAMQHYPQPSQELRQNYLNIPTRNVDNSRVAMFEANHLVNIYYHEELPPCFLTQVYNVRLNGMQWVFAFRA